MVLKRYYVKGMVFLTIAVLSQGCGSVDSSISKEETVNSSNNQLNIDDKNYLKVSKYIYARQQAYEKLNASKTPNKSRNLATKSTSSNPHILNVNAKNGRMIINQNGKKVLVNVDEKSNKVVVSYEDATQHKKQMLVLDKFQDLN